jgi:hypothetical protein
MPVATLGVQQVTRNGLSPEYVDVDTDGAMFVNNGSTVLDIWNTGAGAVNVTVVIQQTVDGQTVPARTYTVPNTTAAHGENQLLIGPFPIQVYNNESNQVVIDVDASGCAMAAFRM